MLYLHWRVLDVRHIGVKPSLKDLYCHMRHIDVGSSLKNLFRPMRHANIGPSLKDHCRLMRHIDVGPSLKNPCRSIWYIDVGPYLNGLYRPMRDSYARPSLKDIFCLPDILMLNLTKGSFRPTRHIDVWFSLKDSRQEKHKQHFRDSPLQEIYSIKVT